MTGRLGGPMTHFDVFIILFQVFYDQKLWKSKGMVEISSLTSQDSSEKKSKLSQEEIDRNWAEKNDFPPFVIKLTDNYHHTFICFSGEHFFTCDITNKLFIWSSITAEVSFLSLSC